MKNIGTFRLSGWILAGGLVEDVVVVDRHGRVEVDGVVVGLAGFVYASSA
jgi:hypothetical protein